ncbi:MAG: cysteine--tRNA ligase [Nitrosomonadales bacterium]
MIKLYNNLTRKKEVFLPINPGRVGMYVCGMTVYDFCHLGHARVLIFFDLLYRWLMVNGLQVNYVRNITDIDDKIINKANSESVSINDLTARYIQEMNTDSDYLGILQPSIQPRATSNIEEMIKMIKTLEKKGFAYQASNKDVFFEVHKFKDYGKLSNKNLDDLISGARVENNPVKRNPEDFVLWKFSENEEIGWDSPWGKGRPGWHIECSAMSNKYLGNHFDIHGGGQDLIFPHHENEIAQSECCNNSKMANYWIHNGFVNVDSEKMSKSLNNFFTIRELSKQYKSDVIRFFILKSHYRSPLNFTDENLEDSKSAVYKIFNALRKYELQEIEIDWTNAEFSLFKDALNDDLNTPLAFSILFEMINQLNKTENNKLANEIYSILLKLGFLQNGIEEYFSANQDIDAKLIENLISKRAEAKIEKNYELADKIRIELDNMGIILEDGPLITTWKVKQ